MAEQVVVEIESYEVVIEELLSVEVLEETTLAVTEEVGVEIIEVGEVGPAGPPGESADATFEWASQNFDIAVDSQQVFELDFEPRAGSVTVFFNGLLERFWSLASTTLTLEDAALEGDNVTVNYQKET